MKVFKFGGASVKSAEAVKNLASIMHNYHERIVIVISAMGKTTNAMEEVARTFFDGKNFKPLVDNIKKFHFNIIKELFPDQSDPVYQDVSLLFSELDTILSKQPSLNFDFDYDQVVSFGELFSTKIVSAYLNAIDIPVKFIDVRRVLKTDNTYREAKVDWELTTGLMKKTFDFKKELFYLTQGFIGSTINNLTTTLGREGSDYTGAIISHVMEAESLTIWKDVPGVLNADPKYFDDTVMIDQLSYLDAIELAYFGASVIHPKTIKPLQNKNIKLYVRSFLKPGDPGTVIGDYAYESLMPTFIFKVDQVLLQISPLDFSFIAEDNLRTIFDCFSRHNVKINLMQNSAVSFRVCTNNDQSKLPGLLKDLREDFRVTIESGLELITIRYYDDATIDRVLVDKKLLLEHKTGRTMQMVVNPLPATTG